MNAMIVQAARGKHRGRVNSSTVDTGSRLDHLHALEAEHDAAMRSGDADAVSFVEHKIDTLIDESRAARSPAEGFGGGVQRRPRPRVGGASPTANQLMVEAMIQSRVEAAAIPRELRASNLKL